MAQFPELGRTYELVPKESTNLDYNLYRCLNPICSSSRDNQSCMQKVQRACADNNWRRGWCRQQRDNETTT